MFSLNYQNLLVRFYRYLHINNAYVEWIFAIMGNSWTDNRNKMRVELVKPEFCIKLNFDISCREFYVFIKKKTENVDLVKAVVSNRKYGIHGKIYINKLFMILILFLFFFLFTCFYFIRKLLSFYQLYA